MTTSLEYEEMAISQIKLIDEVGTKAIEVTKLYTKLAEVAAIREQTEVMRRNGY